ncbi:MAG: CARDB domain-containing protein [Candidatus Pacearchaeota archaeon]|jgi:hypothetical protein
MKQKILTITLILILVANIVPLVNSATTSDDLSVGDYDITYSYDLAQAQAGERFNLKITITNADTEDKDDIMFSFDLNSPFDISSDDEEWDIGDLSAGESISKIFRIEVDENTDSDDYKAKFNLEDSDDEWNDYFTIEVNSNKADIIIASVESSPLTLTPNLNDAKLTVHLENQGTESAKFLKAKLILPEGFSATNSYSDTASIGTIAGESKQNAVFYINTDKTLKSGVYTGTIELIYKEGSQDKTKTLQFDLPVQGSPQFKIISVIPESKIMPKQTSKIKVTLTNTGDKKAEETSIKVFEKSDYPFSFTEKTYYIGTLEPGQSSTAIFELTTDSDATANTYIVNTQIRTVSDGSVLVSEESMSIRIYEYEKTASDYLKIIGIVTLIILALVGFLLYRISKKRKKNSTKEIATLRKIIR